MLLQRTKIGKGNNLPYLSLKLFLLDYMMSHAITIVQEEKYSIWKQLTYRSDMSDNHTCPRLLNKQMKFLLSTLYKDLFSRILQRVQNMLLASRKDTWTQSFAVLLILAIVSGSLQTMIRCKEHSNMSAGLTFDGIDATNAIQDIEDRFKFLTQLLHIKYNKRGMQYGNPLFNKCVRDDLGNSDRHFMESVSGLVTEHSMLYLWSSVARFSTDRSMVGTYLQRLSNAPVPVAITNDRLEEPNGRMLAQLILSFCQPDIGIGQS